ncbi:hypothetical protein GPECTOR_35g820 [Gonium pectorale]|uniref:Uncharacterized protein n=1 Tax=Gonium pectorale TaxID=33097 RepID=A0A150GC20_GONPE|nr:hypothetical protein GPECTOR_35g820 [Gonium pectorale]|eukprot:KXZ47382.1 hypothetical protein GPECTOR_35g820 [Gonium pectorale]
MFNSQSCLSNFVEQDGCARTVIVLLLLTTVGCISYTWGYYEGIANGQSNLMLDELHKLQLLQMQLAAKVNGTDPTVQAKPVVAHGMRLAEVAPGEPAIRQPVLDPAEADRATIDAAPVIEDTAPVDISLDRDEGLAQLRGAGNTERHKVSRKSKAGRVQEGGT